MMPIHRAGVKPDASAARLQSPADVDVVAGRAIARIESADRLQCRSPERHVASGNVLGFGIGNQHVHRPTGRIRDAIGDRPVARRRDIRAADTDPIAGHEAICDVVQPVRIGPGIVVDVRNDLAGRRLPSEIARRRQAVVRGADQSDEIVFGDDVRSRIGRAVVDDDHFEVGIS